MDHLVTITVPKWLCTVLLIVRSHYCLVPGATNTFPVTHNYGFVILSKMISVINCCRLKRLGFGLRKLRDMSDADTTKPGFVGNFLLVTCRAKPTCRESKRCFLLSARHFVVCLEESSKSCRIFRR